MSFDNDMVAKTRFVVPKVDRNDSLLGEGIPATLQEAALRELVNAHVVTGFLARGNCGGFVLEALFGDRPGHAAVLGNTRRGPRVFASLETVSTLVQRFGFDRFTVDVTGYVRGRVRAARPDRSVAMKAVKMPKRPPSVKKS